MGSNIQEFEGKRLRYINIFVLLGRDEDLGGVVKVVEGITRERGCEYTIKRSFLGNFYYIKISCRSADLEDLRNKIELELGKLVDTISWFKTEVIEVK